MGRAPEKSTNKGKPELPRRVWNFQKKERDPNAMDVDAMNVERRDEMMKKGLCFKCGKPGHISKNCPPDSDDKKPPSYSPKKPDPPKKFTPKELYAHIRTLTAEMTEEERDQFYKEAEDEGF